MVRAAAWELSALVPPLILVLATLWAFLPILNNDFVAWDDDKNFLANPRYRGLGWANVAWAWTTFHLGVYQPLTWMLFGLEFVMCRLDPGGYHLASLLLHAAVGVALYALSVRLVRRARPECSPWAVRSACLAATAFFVVHPLRVEVVAWVSCQGYLPCALFSILAVLAYERSRPPDPVTRTGSDLAAPVLFGAALLCHATALGLPIALIALDYYPLRRLDSSPAGWQAFREKWPFFLVAGVFCVLGYLAKGSTVRSLEDHGPIARLAHAGYGAIFYLFKTILPYGLHAHHPMPPTISLVEPDFLLTFLLAAGISLIALARARRQPGLAAGWIAYLAILAPSSGLVTFGHQLVADRYSYLAMMPWSIVPACWLAGAITSRGRLILVLSSGLVLLLGLLTREQCCTWRNSVRLWTNVLAWDDTSSSAHNNLGAMLAVEGRYRDALRHYELAVKYSPRSAGMNLNCGVLLAEQGEPAAAQDYLEEALRLDPSVAETRAWLAMVLSDQDRTAEALAHSGRALREAPNSARVLMARGTILARAGRLDESGADLERARRLDPGLQSPPLSLALALKELGQLAQAEQVLRDLLIRNPESAEAHARLGEVLAKRGDRLAAAEQYRQALRIRPGHPRALQWLNQAAGK